MPTRGVLYLLTNLSLEMYVSILRICKYFSPLSVSSWSRPSGKNPDVAVIIFSASSMMQSMIGSTDGGNIIDQSEIAR